MTWLHIAILKIAPQDTGFFQAKSRNSGAESSKTMKIQLNMLKLLVPIGQQPSIRRGPGTVKRQKLNILSHLGDAKQWLIRKVEMICMHTWYESQQLNQGCFSCILNFKAANNNTSLNLKIAWAQRHHRCLTIRFGSCAGKPWHPGPSSSPLFRIQGGRRI